VKMRCPNTKLFLRGPLSDFGLQAEVFAQASGSTHGGLEPTATRGGEGSRKWRSKSASYGPHWPINVFAQNAAT